MEHGGTYRQYICVCGLRPAQHSSGEKRAGQQKHMLHSQAPDMSQQPLLASPLGATAPKKQRLNLLNAAEVRKQNAHKSVTASLEAIGTGLGTSCSISQGVTLVHMTGTDACAMGWMMGPGRGRNELQLKLL